MPIYTSTLNLARQGIAKTFTHGYAQSLVAATHPQVYASQNKNGFTRQRRASKLTPFNNYQFQNAFHSSASTANVGAFENRPERIDGALLSTYFESKQQSPDRELDQFPFLLPVEYPTSQVDLGLSVDAQEGHGVETVPKPITDRAYSTSAVDDIKKVRFNADEEAALAQVDAAIEKEIRSRAEHQSSDNVAAAARVTTPSVDVESLPLTAESDVEASPVSVATSIENSASEYQSQKYADHLAKLSESGRYGDIPVVFEAMLVAKIQPTAHAYNVLLDAVVKLPMERIQVVPKALDVYSDMLRRRVSPNTTTFDKLINLLATRSLEVTSLKQSLEEKRARFGGMTEPGKFMFASHELESEILAEDNRVDLALQLFESSISQSNDRSYPPETYHQLISACSDAGRVPEMIRLYGHMETHKVTPLATTFPTMIHGFTRSGDLCSAVECYNEYKRLAIAADDGKLTFKDRQDAQVYAAVVRAYIISDKVGGAMEFYGKIDQVFGSSDLVLINVVVMDGFVKGLLLRGMLLQALAWAERLGEESKVIAMSKISVLAADKNDKLTALAAFNHLLPGSSYVTAPIIALIALNVREGDIVAAQHYWQMLSSPETPVDTSFIEPTTMYAVAMIGSGQVAEGLNQSEQMFARIKAGVSGANVEGEIDEGIEFISRFMTQNGITDPRQALTEINSPASYAAVPYEDTFDPYAASTDFKGSALIADELERGNSGRKTSLLTEALGRFRNMRRAGRHPRYITYAKLITAAAREERMSLVHDIIDMARTDVPLLPQYAVVRYGWVSIFDAIIGACLNLGQRQLAAQYHQELRDMGAAPTANTFGLYITTLKESTRTFDEASEAVKIFHRAKEEGVEPSSFLYNALIGKLGKARRIDDCLFYFAEMRARCIRPTSVTYGTIVNALCRVSDEKFAEELFEEMESMQNYKARPAPYNSLMQFFLTTKRNKGKVLAYYERMQKKGIVPTSHTYKLLIDTYATLEPVNMAAAEAVLDVVRSTGQKPEPVHYSSLIHAKGCVMHDMEGARAVFDAVMSDSSIRPQACLFQALFESMVANHLVADAEPLLKEMSARHVEMTPYIANTLIHGWANERLISKSKAIFDSLPREKREPSTYEAMTRAYLTVEDRVGAKAVVQEMLHRGYPTAVSNKVYDLLGGVNTDLYV